MNERYVKEYLNYLTYVSTCRSLMDWAKMFGVETKGKIKQVFNNTGNHLERSSNAAIWEIKQGMGKDEEAKKQLDVYIDNIGAGAIEVIREFHLSKDKEKFLACSKLFNAELISEDNDLEKILNDFGNRLLTEIAMGKAQKSSNGVAKAAKRFLKDKKS